MVGRCTTLVQTEISQQAIKSLDIHDPQRMNLNDFVDPLTFPLVPLAG